MRVRRSESRYQRTTPLRRDTADGLRDVDEPRRQAMPVADTPTVSNPKLKFAGHQTFVFRYGWLEKGVRGVHECPSLFSQKDALVRLGVGKNMVSSIRYWCEATQLIQADRGAGVKDRSRMKVSEIGQRLLLDNGWDPFLEDDASLWLIHWLLISNPIAVTPWQLVFSRFHRPDFTRRELIAFISSIAERQAHSVSSIVITRDVDCFIRCYATNPKEMPTPGEGYDCPLLQLDLMRPSPGGDLYRFAIGPKPSLPPAIFAFALTEYFSRVAGTTNTLSIQKCLYGEGSPGQVFKLDENSLIGYVEELEERTERALILDETAGLKQIYRRRSVDSFAVLDEYYQGHRR